MSGIGSAYQIVGAFQVCEKYLVNGKNVYWLSRTYIIVERHAMGKVLWPYGVSECSMRPVQSYYVDRKACAKIESKVSE